MADTSKSALLALRSRGFQRVVLGHSRNRKIYKTITDVKITILCGLVTFMVLRSCIGGGKFRTPMEDLEDFRQGRKHLYRAFTDMRGKMTDSAQALSEMRGRMTGSANALAAVQDKFEGDKVFTPPKPHTNLGALEILDWDQQRQLRLNEIPQLLSSDGNRKPRILLVTGSQPAACQNAVGDHYLLKFAKNKIDYCRIHGIEIFYNMAQLDPEMTSFWAKLPIIRKLMLTHPEVEWIWWMDSDAMFTDMAFELPMEKYTDHNMILHGWDELVYEKREWTGLNTGSFLIRNCQWSLDLIDAWAPMGPKGSIREEAGKLLSKELEGRPEFEADDQSALVYLLITQRSKWSGKVFLENSYYLHGYWEILVDKYEGMMEKNHERWPLVTHFVGCKPCGGAGAPANQRCMRQMERAFNFADNQILKEFGFRHPSLGAMKVEQIPNDTTAESRPLDVAELISRKQASAAGHELHLAHNHIRAHKSRSTKLVVS